MYFKTFFRFLEGRISSSENKRFGLFSIDMKPNAIPPAASSKMHSQSRQGSYRSATIDCILGIPGGLMNVRLSISRTEKDAVYSGPRLAGNGKPADSLQSPRTLCLNGFEFVSAAYASLAMFCQAALSSSLAASSSRPKVAPSAITSEAAV